MVKDVQREIEFKTSRSGGKGGQHVNKVETKATGFWHVANSSLLTDAEKEQVSKKLHNQMNSDGFLVVTAESSRSQLANKEEVIKKINAKLNHALQKQKIRKPTKPTKTSVEKRLEYKKQHALQKQNRRKIW